MLTDASAIIALLSRRDRFYPEATQALARLSPPALLTTLPCFTEASQMLHRTKPHEPSPELYEYLANGFIQIHLPTQAEIQRARALVDKYDDRPMSFADASLIAAAETLNQRRIFTYDSDFYIYLINNSHPVEVIQ